MTAPVRAAAPSILRGEHGWPCTCCSYLSIHVLCWQRQCRGSELPFPRFVSPLLWEGCGPENTCGTVPLPYYREVHRRRVLDQRKRKKKKKKKKIGTQVSVPESGTWAAWPFSRTSTFLFPPDPCG